MYVQRLLDGRIDMLNDSEKNLLSSIKDSEERLQKWRDKLLKVREEKRELIRAKEKL